MNEIALGPCVYVMIVTTAGPEAYFKIGMSSNFADRIDAVQTGCPLPIERVLWVPARDSFEAAQLERAFHLRFRSRHTHGEWFLFDLEDESAKAEFQQGSADILGDRTWKVWDEGSFQTRAREFRRASRQRMDPMAQRVEQRRRDVQWALRLMRPAAGRVK